MHDKKASLSKTFKNTDYETWDYLYDLKAKLSLKIYYFIGKNCQQKPTNQRSAKDKNRECLKNPYVF